MKKELKEIIKKQISNGLYSKTIPKIARRRAVKKGLLKQPKP